jgi:hypothetical protein
MDILCDVNNKKYERNLKNLKKEMVRKVAYDEDTEFGGWSECK